MQKQDRSRLKSIGVDILGVLAIIAAGIIGPIIPGPGGIPLLILGLSLLATNHEWAERWLTTVKKQGLNVSDKIFSDKPSVKIGLDIASIVLITGGVLLVTLATKSLFKTAAISLFITAIILFLGNRKRATKIKHRILKHKQ